MEYIGQALESEISIDKLYTIHYFEYGKRYAFPGERHDFWECVYVDRGEIIVTAREREVRLCRGEILFHEPNEWHTLRANGQVAPNLVVFSFSSDSPAMEYFRERHFRIGQRARALIGAVLREAGALFATPLGNPATHEMLRQEGAPRGTAQLIRLHLEELLLVLLREDHTPPETPARRVAEGDLYAHLCAYMQAHIGERMTLSDLGREGGVSESTVKAVFRRRAGCGAMAFYARMRVEAARTYIREGNYNLSEIADLLGYESIHYFSRQFRRICGMSPSEYSRSVRALEDGTEKQE